MKSIQVDIVVTGIRAKIDGSLGFNASTPELTSEEKVAFMGLQGVALKALLTPIDEPLAPVVTIDKELSQKTPGQRLRSALYVLYMQENDVTKLETIGFEDYYKKQMEHIINLVKDKFE
jgi:hypothetical protein